MTEAELFPRGKTAKDDPSSKQRHQQQQSKSREQEKNGARGEAIKGGEEKKAKLGRKRKAPGAPAASPGASGRESAEEDWLFGSPNQAKVPSSTSSSKKSRGGQSLGGSRTLGDKVRV